MSALGPTTARLAATRTATWLAVGLAPRRLALAWSTASTCMLDRASAGPALERVPPACTDRLSSGSGVERAPLACSDRPSLRSPLDCVLFPHSTAPRLALPVCCSCWYAQGSPLSGAPRASPAERCSPPVRWSAARADQAACCSSGGPGDRRSGASRRALLAWGPAGMLELARRSATRPSRAAPLRRPLLGWQSGRAAPPGNSS